MKTAIPCNRVSAILSSLGLALVLMTRSPVVSAAGETKAESELVLVGGVADLRKSDKLPFGVVQLRLKENYRGVHPYANVGWGGGGNGYAGAGLLYNFEMPRRLRLTLGTGPGYYRHAGNHSNLGYAVEFYSWVELSALVMDRRIGLSFGHLSNASLGSRNPGTEDVSLSISVISW
jgi:hypothetical protein